MNIQQIEALCGVVRNRFSISTAAEVLSRSQPQLSRQIKDLELELGVRLFSRTRNKVISLTPNGEEVVKIGQRILRDLKNLQQVGGEDTSANPAELKIATTHVHARYSLPKIIRHFNARHPNVTLTLRQGDPAQCAELVANGEADIGIATLAPKASDDVVAIPIYKLPRCVIVPRNHRLVHEKTLTIEKLAEFPLIAYSPSFSSRSIVDEAFVRANLRPRVVCTAIDADISKTYVELGMGIAILAKVVFDPARDRNLVALDVEHLFRPGILHVLLRKHSYLSSRACTFVTMYAPHLDRELVRKAMNGQDIDRMKIMQNTPVATFR